LTLFSLVDRLYNGLRALFALYDSDVVPKLVNVPPKCPESPIFALFTPLPRDLAQYCQQVGFVVRAVVPPTVPPGTERVRICLHAGNTEEQVDNFVQVVKRWIDSKAGKAPKQSRTMEGAKL
jgi:8-amino-7-oxononanoate synthase